MEAELREKTQLIDGMTDPVATIISEKIQLLEDIMKLQRENTDQKEVINDLEIRAFIPKVMQNKVMHNFYYNEAQLKVQDKVGADSWRKVRDMIRKRFPCLDLGFLAEVCDDQVVVELSESNDEEVNEEGKEVPNN